ncbi:MAG TPA: hypothetical protein PKA41_19805, partial [Verrucomicrobiota bacterium]|nr:hypothetical protein [Verrucomicrobiota bacterium]
FNNQGGGQLTLNTAANANRTSAGVTLSGGTMRLGNASALGTVGVPLTLNGGTLHLAINGSVNAHNTTVGGNAAIVSDRSTSGSGVTSTLGTLGIGTQTLSVTAGTNVTSGTAGITFGPTTMSGNATFDVVGGNAQLTLGAIGESGGARSLAKTGNGTLRLNGAGSYTGGTTLSEGAITLGVANALGSGGFNFAGGTLNASNFTDSTIGALTLSADSTLNLSPGGASGILTFSGVSGTADGILTITGWSGSVGGLGTDDKIIFSGGTTPGTNFLHHIRFDLGDANTYPGDIGPGGELIPKALSEPPNLPASVSPADGAFDVTNSPTLNVTVSDPDSDDLTVTFYGRVANPPAGADFTLIALPDTQYYVSSLNGGSPAMFTNQTQWIVNERVNRNIQYVAQLGDCTQNGDNGGNDSEWRVATNALYRLENPLTTSLPDGVPYGVAVGNHDQSPIGSSTGTTTFYNQYFGEAHFSSKGYYGGHYGTNNDNHFDLFSASGLDFIVIYFEYNSGMTTNSPVLAWANSVLQTNQSRR